MDVHRGRHGEGESVTTGIARVERLARAMPGAMPSRYHVVRSKTAVSDALKSTYALSRTALLKLHANKVTMRHVKKTGNLPDQVLFMCTRMAIGKSNLP